MKICSLLAHTYVHTYFPPLFRSAFRHSRMLALSLSLFLSLFAVGETMGGNRILPPLHTQNSCFFGSLIKSSFFSLGSAASSLRANLSISCETALPTQCAAAVTASSSPFSIDLSLFWNICFWHCNFTFVSLKF